MIAFEYTLGNLKLICATLWAICATLWAICAPLWAIFAILNLNSSSHYETRTFDASNALEIEARTFH